MLGKQLQTAAAGSAGGDPVYVDDVFSTFLYEGNGSTQTITNSIDISGEGGLVWLKSRSSGFEHSLFDTERGAGKYLVSNSTAVESTNTTRLSAFNSNGFSLGDDVITNSSGDTYASWTFRKAPGFFDVVTYTGNGSNRTISHNLGSVPGMIIISGRDIGTNNTVYHRSLGNTQYIKLNASSTPTTSSTAWNNTDPTSSVFSLGTNSGVNSNGYQYVAWIFAHNEQSFGKNSDEAIIHCGSYTGTGSGTPNLVNIGFEPQWLMVKNTTTADNWSMHDVMRGATTEGTYRLKADGTVTESEWGAPFVPFESQGFTPTANNGEVNSSGDTFIYLAIRRPHKEPENATDVFDVNLESNDNNFSTTGFPVDAAISVNREGSSHTAIIGARLIGDKLLRTGLTNNEAGFLPSNQYAYQYMDKFRYSFWGTNTGGFVNYAFKRAPGFFDVVTYAGNDVSGTQISHNLGATPEMFMVKNRTNSWGWNVYHQGVASDAETDYLQLNTNAAASDDDGRWADTAPTSSVFTVGAGQNVNASGSDYIAYLFATLPGISKVGTYTGTGSAINVDCGFTAGARFVLIKRTDSTGNWFTFDTERGIVSGNDPFMRLNLINAENTSNDMIDPLNAGFSVASGSTDVNASGGTYLFLAIA